MTQITMLGTSLLLRIDQKISLKHVHRQLQVVAKLLIVTTFVEDAVRILTSFNVQQQSMQFAKWQSKSLHTALPVLSVLIQTTGAALILLSNQTSSLPKIGCNVLIAWCFWHPIMYNQVAFFQSDRHTNWEFVSETLTIVGGLLILLSHYLLSSPEAKLELPAGASSPSGGKLTARAHRLQALGRTLIVSIFLYMAGQKMHIRMQKLDLGGHKEEGVFDWASAGFEFVGALVLLYICSLVIVGMKSRLCALLLAAAMACGAVYMHPFWLFIFSSRRFQMWGVSGMDGYEVDAFTMADHQRYFFFQSMSTVGALLLLVVYGPGAISIDEPDGMPTKILSAKGDA